jgi:hypothetical protein
VKARKDGNPSPSRARSARRMRSLAPSTIDRDAAAPYGMPTPASANLRMSAECNGEAETGAHLRNLTNHQPSSVSAAPGGEAPPLGCHHSAAEVPGRQHGLQAGPRFANYAAIRAVSLARLRPRTSLRRYSGSSACDRDGLACESAQFAIALDL